MFEDFSPIYGGVPEQSEGEGVGSQDMSGLTRAGRVGSFAGWNRPPTPLRGDPFPHASRGGQIQSSTLPIATDTGWESPNEGRRRGNDLPGNSQAKRTDRSRQR